MRERGKLGESLPRTNLGSLCSCSKGNYYASGEMLWRLVLCKFGWQGGKRGSHKNWICINEIRIDQVPVPKASQELDTA
jgi:hypothetical protein